VWVAHEIVKDRGGIQRVRSYKVLIIDTVFYNNFSVDVKLIENNNSFYKILMVVPMII